MHVSNSDFLTALFGNEAPWVHVTDFNYDPNNIPRDKHLSAWKGDYFCRYQFQPLSNQYFTISNFYADENGTARRRKSLFRFTPVIVLDDVVEKLSLDAVSKLPSPSWILETSPGSEQWGYILNKPCEDRSKIENLLDGLVSNGLAPDGKDPGMKGVTRYVRLPGGYNTKSSKMINGQPFKCHLKLWTPFNRVTIEQLAQPFGVNLHAVRREQRTDGASDISDHPLINIPEIINIKEVRSDGRFDITCPWVNEHTNHDDSGSAIFTNDDGSIGFKCHHGSCQHRTGKELLTYIESKKPGFSSEFNSWKLFRSFNHVTNNIKPQISFIQPKTIETVSIDDVISQPISSVDGYQQVIDALRREHPTSNEARQLASSLLKAVDSIPQIDKKNWHEQICDVMQWSKQDFREILKDLRKQWYSETKTDADFYNSVIYIKEQNQFYDWKSRIFFTPEAFQNSFVCQDPEARKTALQEGRVVKVDRLDYAPKQPRIFEDKGIIYGNTWYESNDTIGSPGDASRWLDHWDALGWSGYRKHMLQWMAFTIIHPDKKINHMLLMGSGEGCGKDFLLYPLIKALGDNSTTIAGEELLDGFNDYVLSTKHLHVNEAELGDRREATAISNKLKPLAAAPPDTLRVNQKGIKPIKVRNVLNASMTTNSQLPLRLNGPSRRFFAVWSDLNTRNEYDETLPEWIKYWDDRWQWMRNGGADVCIWYLKHQVDLSDFDPGAAPPMTEFLRDIREASKTPAQLTIETFINHRIGAFSVDLVCSTDASNTLRAGELLHNDYMSVEGKFFTPHRVGAIMKELPQCIRLRACRGAASARVWAIRDLERYKSMGPAELYTEYERQLQEARRKTPMTVVQ